MQIQKIDENLDKIENFYREDEETRKQQTIEAFKKLHKALYELKEKYPDVYDYFLRTASEYAGGIYIPYLFWDPLFRFIHNDESARATLQYLIDAFATGDFEEEEQQLMKPLLSIYFYYERTFEKERFKATYYKQYHRDVQNYLDELMEFGQKNKRSIAIYVKKFKLVGNQFPDFELFSLPLDEIQSQMGE